MSEEELFLFTQSYVECLRSDLSSYQVVYLAGYFDAGNVWRIWGLLPLRLESGIS